ncbi:hypothetical protein TcWFU_002422 [Taenia crassiceps]|uniref:Uncharacterized protein n=1 Tax=Taenia crassiceps TaxID=6207 RepID=A0ABR4QKH3_9CEST
MGCKQSQFDNTDQNGLGTTIAALSLCVVCQCVRFTLILIYCCFNGCARARAQSLSGHHPFPLRGGFFKALTPTSMRTPSGETRNESEWEQGVTAGGGGGGEALASSSSF